MKIFKLLAVAKIADVIYGIVGILKDQFYMHRTKINSSFQMIRVIVSTSLAIHIMVCIWVRMSLYFEEDSEFGIHDLNQYEDVKTIK